MPNPLDTNRIKQKLCVCLILCAPMLSGASQRQSVECGSYSLKHTLLIAIVVGLLHNTMVCLQKIITGNK